MFLTYRGPANESGCNLPCGFTQTLTQGFIIYFSFVVFTLKRLFSHPSLYALINGINYWLCEWLRNEANIWFNKKRIFFFLLLWQRCFPAGEMSFRHVCEVFIPSFHIHSATYMPLLPLLPACLPCLVQEITQNSQGHLQRAGRG